MHLDCSWLRYARTFPAGVILFFCFVAASPGQLINFETTPSGAIPADDQVLTLGVPYTFPGPLQVTFGFDTDVTPGVDTPAVIEHIGLDAGDPATGGFGGTAGGDTADPGFESQLGDYFLRGPSSGLDFGKFVIQYTTPLTITAASGEIWDIDGTGTELNPGFTEQYRVRAFDSSNNVLDTIDSPVGTLLSSTAPLDGQPWTFNFSGLSGSIDHIEITFMGTKTTGIGLAFNNFYPTTVAPEPGMGLIAVLAVVIFHRRTR